MLPPRKQYSLTIPDDLSVDGTIVLGNESTDTITLQGRLILRTLASNPLDAIPANRPAGSTGEVAYYSGNIYVCGNSTGPIWTESGSIVVGDLALGASGSITWDNGSGTVDVNLYRGGANTLETDDQLVVNSLLTANAALTVQGTSTINGTLDINSDINHFYDQTVTNPATLVDRRTSWNPSANPGVVTTFIGSDSIHNLGGTGGANEFLIGNRLSTTITGAGAGNGGITGMQINHTQNIAQTTPTAYGFEHVVTADLGTITLATGFLANQKATMVGTITEYNGFRVEQTNTVGTITHAYGLRIDAIGGRGSTSGLAIAMKSDGTAKTGLGWATSFPGVADVNLYRSAANVLKTDDQFVCNNRQIIWVPAGAFTPVSTNGASLNKVETINNKLNIDYVAFDPNSQEFADFTMIMPERWDLGTIKAKFYWTTLSAPGGTKVEFDIKATAKGDDDALDVVWGTEQLAWDTYSTAMDVHVSSATAAITIAGSPALGDLINFRVSRNVTSANDDIDQDALLLGVAIQYLESATVADW